jgi:hypothetical protein
MEYKDDELRTQKQISLAQNISFMWKITSPLLVSDMSIFVNAYIDGRPTPSVASTILELLPRLQGPLGIAPSVIQDYLSARASPHRIRLFLRTVDKDGSIGINYPGIWSSNIQLSSGQSAVSITQHMNLGLALTGVDVDSPAKI